MKRIYARYSVLTVLWVSVGLIVFSVLWVMFRGKSDATGGIAFAGAMIFVVSGAMFGSEVNMAIRAVNYRVDERIRHGTDQDRVIAEIRRHLGMSPTRPDDTPPHGVPIYPKEAPR